MSSIDNWRKAAAFLESLRLADKKHHEGRILNNKSNYYCCSDCPSNFGPGQVEELLAMFLEAQNDPRS